VTAGGVAGAVARSPGIVAFQGSRRGRSAFALVNARWSAGLAATGEYEVIDYDPASPRRPDVLIHHDFASHFADFRTPPGSRAVAVRTWDFGPLPTAWVAKINREFRQFWAHSRWIARQARAAGVEADRIRVVAHGVDPEVYRPDGERYPLPSRPRLVFLFVGGVCLRKGSDTLLKAYAQAFSASDDVMLVVKDHSADLFYRDDTIRRNLLELMQDPGAPRIVHIDRFLPEPELASLYRACDVAVFPYRAEGFCLPVLECMAAGTPAIVPNFGACLDFCSEETSYPMPVQRIQIPVHARFKVAMGFADDVEAVDFCEVRVGTLADYLRRAYEESATSRARRATAGVSVAHGRFTWRESLATVRRCLAELVGDGRQPPPAASASITR
jgi:glycosyltransferase involved in cell wall biosynthesis